MSDERTDKVRLPGADRDSNTQDQVQLTQRVNDLMELLRSQREILQSRGMNLPSGSLDSLRTLKTRLDGLSRQLIATQIELRQLRALADTTALINSSLETDAVLNQVMDTVITITGAERGYIVLKNRETGELDQFRVARGLDREQLVGNDTSTGTRKGEFIVSKTIVRDVASSGDPVLTDNASHDERYQGQQSVVGFGLRSILAVPLKVRGEVIGVVYCDNRVLSGLFQKGDLELLQAFSNQAAVAIENAQLFESARQRLREITETRDLMDNIFDSITSGIVTVDNNGTINYCNEAAQRILSVGDVQNQHLEDILPELTDTFYETLNRVIETGEQQFVEVEPVLEDRGTRYWNVIVSPLRDASGKMQGLALVLDDFTDQKRREATLAEVARYMSPELMLNLRSMDDVSVAGQEREITSISTDVRGYTSFSDQFQGQPEVVMEIINKYLSVASDAINLYEGIVEKYMGDAVTGLFNTQLNPHEDHAVRAVRAAMSIKFDLDALHETLTPDQRLYFGIGVHTGAAFLGNVGSPDRKEFAALGDATTISKILEGNAKENEIVISPATYELIKDFFECETFTPDPEKLKGRTDLDMLYKVTKRKRGATTGSLFIDPELADLLKGD